MNFQLYTQSAISHNKVITTLLYVSKKVDVLILEATFVCNFTVLQWCLKVPHQTFKSRKSCKYIYFLRYVYINELFKYSRDNILPELIAF